VPFYAAFGYFVTVYRLTYTYLAYKLLNVLVVCKSFCNEEHDDFEQKNLTRNL